MATIAAVGAGPTAPAGAAPPVAGVQMVLTPWIGGVQSSAPIFWGTTIHYELALTNTTGADTSAFTVVVPVPRDGIYVTGSATCGDVPNCSAAENFSKHDNIVFSVSSLPAGGGPSTASLDVTLRTGAQYQDIAEVAHLFGDGCPARVCSSNKAKNHVLPRPVILTSFPGNNGAAPTSSVVAYTLTVRNYSHQAQTDVTVTDPVPDGTSYVPGSVSCRKAPQCTASESNGLTTFHFATVPVRPGKLFKVGFNVTVTATTGNIKDQAQWTGDLCTIAACDTNLVVQSVNGVALTSAGGGTGSTGGTGGATGAGGTGGTGTTPAGPSTASGGAGSAGGTAGSPPGPVGGVTNAHTGLPWAGSRRFVVAAVGLGFMLVGLGLFVRASRSRRRGQASAI